ncbi:KxYKxGKxW signal peptide domain-containing protein [Lacticaseibacillus nasuensis]|uniref:KxYKxGKxW signal peptide domain-containing protein n=1 Tax=Lacticaseibacillus nasuensis TaxID=944671 RepID=UPI001CDACB9A
MDSRLQRALYQEKRHFKMFKTGKLWATVGISLLFGAGFALTQPSTTAFAATAETTTQPAKLRRLPVKPSPARPPSFRRSPWPAAGPRQPGKRPTSTLPP